MLEIISYWSADKLSSILDYLSLDRRKLYFTNSAQKSGVVCLSGLQVPTSHALEFLCVLASHVPMSPRPRVPPSPPPRMPESPRPRIPVSPSLSLVPRPTSHVPCPTSQSPSPHPTFSHNLFSSHEQVQDNFMASQRGMGTLEGRGATPIHVYK